MNVCVCECWSLTVWWGIVWAPSVFSWKELPACSGRQRMLPGSHKRSWNDQKQPISDFVEPERSCLHFKNHPKMEDKLVKTHFQPWQPIFMRKVSSCWIDFEHPWSKKTQRKHGHYYVSSPYYCKGWQLLQVEGEIHPEVCFEEGCDGHWETKTSAAECDNPNNARLHLCAFFIK